MATISENLQTIKDSTNAIKQAIIDKGGTISGDITTWADAISGIETGGESSKELLLFKINSIVDTRVFESGMTFGEWADSIYNTTSPNLGQIHISEDNLVSTNLGYFYDTNGERFIHSSDRIFPILYALYMAGGSTN